MRPRAVVIDTNVVVAGLLTRDATSPTARILDGMVAGEFVFLLSTMLVAEYRRVLLDPRLTERHGLDERQVDALLAEIAINAVVREPRPATEPAPDADDQHLWDLLASEAGATLVTGDQELVRAPPDGASVLSPASFAALL